MCGIFAYIGKKRETIPLIIEGLKTLDYRGYDSAGFATILEHKLAFEKKVGKVQELEEEAKKKRWPCSIAISHTRWATHGRPDWTNAHPHFDHHQKMALVHNGIIENYGSIKKMLQEKGLHFRSETDTEVISQLIGYHYRGDLLQAVQESMGQLKGAFALAILHEEHPDTLIACAHESPLAIGIGEDELFLSSDVAAFARYTKQAVFLHSSEIALLNRKSFEIYDQKKRVVVKESIKLDIDPEKSSKGHFAHYTLKEIHEQPQTVVNALLDRLSFEEGTASLLELRFTDVELNQIERILCLGCGTSYHAGLIGAYMMESRAGLSFQVEISSELRYKNPLVPPGTLALALSQSGETADTLAAMRELAQKGAKLAGICNVQSSSLAREIPSTLFLRAGPEIAVASTKAFTTQLILLSLLTIKMARTRGKMGLEEGQAWIQELLLLPQKIRQILEMEDKIAELAAKYASYDHFFYLGRRYMYPTALEGALKLKEIAYVNAVGYPAGELKHGPIALIDEKCPTMAFCADSVTFPKMVNNLMEVKARLGKIIAIIDTTQLEVERLVEDVIVVPKTIDELSPILSTIASQLFAYHAALKRGCAIDKPRHLAKSVTVE